MILGGRTSRNIKYLFIDGGCLREVLKSVSSDWFDGDPLELDYETFCRSFDKVFYYDALPARNREESSNDYDARVRPQIEHHDHLRGLRGYHVYEGVVHRRRRVLQQKKVDIKLAVDMLTHAFRGNMHQATLFASDLDFKPFLDALVETGMFVELWYPKGRTNNELIYAADFKRPINVQELYNMTTKEYRRKHPVPRTSAGGRIDVTGLTHMRSCACTSGDRIELYKDEERYVATFLEDDGLGRHSGKYHDADYLVRYMADLFGLTLVESDTS